jgi:hypothetical protein
MLKESDVRCPPAGRVGAVSSGFLGGVCSWPKDRGPSVLLAPGIRLLVISSDEIFVCTNDVLFVEIRLRNCEDNFVADSTLGPVRLSNAVS